MLEQDPVEGRQRETKVEIMTKQDPIQKGDKWRQTWNHVGTGSSRRETKGDKGGNHDETRSSRRETKVEIMLEQDPVEGRQRETNADRPGIMLRWNRIQ